MKELKLKIIIAVSFMLISCVIFLLMSGMSAFAEETTLPDSFEEGVADAIEGMEHLPPSWWNEEQALEMAIEKVKQIQVNGELINADWDGEYEYYTLALGTSDKSYNEDSRYSAYFTFYKEEPTFYLESETSSYILCDAYYGIHLMLEDNGSGGMNIYSTTGSKNQPYDYVNSSNKGFRIFEFDENEETGENIVSYYHMTYGTYHCYSKSNLDPSLWDSLGLKAPEVIRDKSVSMNVYFNPSLSGVVDRSFYSNDELFYNKAFTMIIENNSSFPVQYRFAIVPEGVTSINIPSHSDYATASDAVYVFMSKEWVYATDTTDEVNWYNEVPRKQYKATDWHYVGKGETINQRFLWSQIPVNAGTNYNVIVQAVPIEWDCASQMTVSPAAEVYEDLYQFVPANAQTVYSSTFNVKYLGDVQYNYKDTSYGIVPYSSWEDFQRASFSYDAYYDDNGEVIGGSVNLYDDPNSWVNVPTDFGHGTGSLDFDFDVDDLSLDDVKAILDESETYFNFLGVVFAWLPSWFWGTILFGIISLVLIGVVKAIL